MGVYIAGMAVIMLVAHKKHSALLFQKGVRKSLMQLQEGETNRLSAIPEDDSQSDCPRNISVVDLQTVMDQAENLTIVDVRSPVEFQQGHPPASVNVPAFAGVTHTILSNFLTRFTESIQEKGSKVFVLSNCPPYTFDCLWGRERKAAQLLCDAGYGNVSYILGGMEEWRRLRLPLQLGL
jgi:rhodanese-related sulfurtransferase